MEPIDTVNDEAMDEALKHLKFHHQWEYAKLDGMNCVLDILSPLHPSEDYVDADWTLHVAHAHRAAQQALHTALNDSFKAVKAERDARQKA